MRAPKPNGSYSQFGEDVDILAFFGSEFRGVYVDIGANDGICNNVTYLLEKRGWTGLLIEPIPELAVSYQDTRPESVIVQKAVVGPDDPKIVTLNTYTGTNSKGDSYHALSTVDKHSVFHEQVIADGGDSTTIEVEAATLDAILDDQKLEHVDVVSIDVEGLELNVLKGFSLQRFKPRLLIIEDNTLGLDQTVARYLRTYDYQLIRRTGVNNWYVASEEAKDFLGPRIRLRLGDTFRRMITPCRRKIGAMISKQ